MSVFKYSLSAFSQAQNAPEEFEEDIEQISTFFGDFPLHSIKTWKHWPNIFKFQSMSILAINKIIATEDRKQFQYRYLTKVLNNKTGPLFLQFY